MSRRREAVDAQETGTAEDAKVEGNILYKRGDLRGAIRQYQKAFELDPLPVYLSNLSAAQYELGLYKDALSSIQRGLELLASDHELRVKLLFRGVKADLYLQRYDEAGTTIHTIFETCPGASPELLKNVEHLQELLVEIKSAVATFSADESTWKKRLLQVPRYRNAPREWLEFHVIGQDDACSVMGAQELDHKDDLIETERVRMEIPHDSSPFEFSALFGGIGDARNLYGTINDIANQLRNRGEQKTGEMRFHFTLVDIHPTALARDIIVILTLVEIGEMTEEEAETSPYARQLLLMLHYMYWAMVMPPSLHGLMYMRIRSFHELFSKAAALGRPLRCPWMHVERETVTKIRDSFEWWLGDGPRETYPLARMLSYAASRPGDNPDAASAIATAKINEARREDFMRTLSDPQAIAIMKEGAERVGISYEEYVERMKEVGRQENIADLVAIHETTPEGCRNERRSFDKTKIYFPPVDIDEPDLFQRAIKVLQTHNDLAQEHKDLCYKVIEDRVLDAWEPNVTFLDRHKDGELMGGDVFANIHSLFKSRHVDKPTVHERTCLADYSVVFFSRTAEGFRRIFGLGRGSLMLEVIAEDVWRVSDALSFGLLDRLPSFPKFFDRVHFSNVPDYTGGHLSMLPLGRPLLKSHSKSYISHNCMLNTNVWGAGFGGNAEENLDAFIYHYVSAIRKEIPAIFNLELANKPDMLAFYSTWIATSPSTAAQVTRQGLLHVLHGVFIRCVVPAPYRYPRRVTMEPRDILNVHAVFRLLKYLGSFQPAHVLSEFVTSILENKFTTQVPVHDFSPITSPTNSATLPSVSMCCMPFQAEFEVAAALWRPLLSFPILCHVPAATDIGVYSAAFRTLPEHVVKNMPWSQHTLVAVIGSKDELENATLVRTLRRKIQGTRDVKTTINLISTFNWDIESNTAHIPLARPRFDIFQSSSYHIAIVNTIFWSVVSSVEPCARLRLTADLDNQKPPTSSLSPPLKPVGKIPDRAATIVMTAMGYGPPSAVAPEYRDDPIRPLLENLVSRMTRELALDDL